MVLRFTTLLTRLIVFFFLFSFYLITHQAKASLVACTSRPQRKAGDHKRLVLPEDSQMRQVLYDYVDWLKKAVPTQYVKNGRPLDAGSIDSYKSQTTSFVTWVVVSLTSLFCFVLFFF